MSDLSVLKTVSHRERSRIFPHCWHTVGVMIPMLFARVSVFSFRVHCPTGGSKRLTVSRESADSRSNERSLAIDLGGDGRTRPVADSIAGRNLVIQHQLKSQTHHCGERSSGLAIVAAYSPTCILQWSGPT